MYIVLHHRSNHLFPTQDYMFLPQSNPALCLKVFLPEVLWSIKVLQHESTFRMITFKREALRYHVGEPFQESWFQKQIAGKEPHGPSIWALTRPILFHPSIGEMMSKYQSHGLSSSVEEIWVRFAVLLEGDFNIISICKGK